MEELIKIIEKDAYISPNIEVVEIEVEQCILAGGSGNIPGLSPEEW